MIYHLATQDEWEKAGKGEVYTTSSLREEGFIHCSTKDQITPTANRYYHGRDDLMLLVIDEKPLVDKLRYENLEGGKEAFPHLYASLPLSCIMKAIPVHPSEDGSFSLLNTMV